MSDPKRRIGIAAVLMASIAITAMSGAVAELTPARAAQPALGGPVKVAARRLTESQYRHTIADIFGPRISVNARFEPERRQDGLLAIGSTQLSITPVGFEQYYGAARSIADQVLDEKHRDEAVGCKPADPKAADDACAAAFLRKYGELLFRRPLSDAELAARMVTARKGGEAGDFYDGLRLSLVSLLVAPEFMFRIEVAEPDPTNPGRARLDAYTKASRISFLLWDTAPDAELLAAAKAGDLNSEEGARKQLARLEASPRMKDGVRAFFTDMLQLDAFEGLSKDPAIYPKFSQALADSAREETLRMMVDQLVTKRRDYRDIFTTTETWINRPLAAVYKIPYTSKEPWAPYTFDKASERSGVLTQVTFLSTFSHPGRSSPTKRGVKLYEIFMGQPTPDPPPNVDFSKVQASNKGTVRMRLTDHMTNAGCVQCHGVSDPAGLTLEHFDSIGQLRKWEDGQLIDVSGKITGHDILGAQGLGLFLHENPRVPATLVRNVYYYGVGRAVDERDDDFLAAQAKLFAAGGYKVPDLFAQIAASPQFMKVVIPSGAQPALPKTQVAAVKSLPVQQRQPTQRGGTR